MRLRTVEKYRVFYSTDTRFLSASQSRVDQRLLQKFCRSVTPNEGLA